MISICLVLCFFTKGCTFTEDIYYKYVKCFREWTINNDYKQLSCPRDNKYPGGSSNFTCQVAKLVVAGYLPDK